MATGWTKASPFSLSVVCMGSLWIRQLQGKRASGFQGEETTSDGVVGPRSPVGQHLAGTERATVRAAGS